ncbi:hypothetical protein JHK82_055384 [Glycine max]|nr:hypothetical protein JHK82_055384 [Glycine max]
MERLRHSLSETPWWPLSLVNGLVFGGWGRGWAFWAKGWLRELSLKWFGC